MLRSLTILCLLLLTFAVVLMFYQHQQLDEPIVLPGDTQVPESEKVRPQDPRLQSLDVGEKRSELVFKYEWLVVDGSSGKPIPHATVYVADGTGNPQTWPALDWVPYESAEFELQDWAWVERVGKRLEADAAGRVRFQSDQNQTWMVVGKYEHFWGMAYCDLEERNTLSLHLDQSLRVRVVGQNHEACPFLCLALFAEDAGGSNRLLSYAVTNAEGIASFGHLQQYVPEHLRLDLMLAPLAMMGLPSIMKVDYPVAGQHEVEYRLPLHQSMEVHLLNHQGDILQIPPGKDVLVCMSPNLADDLCNGDHLDSIPCTARSSKIRFPYVTSMKQLKVGAYLRPGLHEWSEVVFTLPAPGSQNAICKIVVDDSEPVLCGELRLPDGSSVDNRRAYIEIEEQKTVRDSERRFLSSVFRSTVGTGARGWFRFVVPSRLRNRKDLRLSIHVQMGDEWTSPRFEGEFAISQLFANEDTDLGRLILESRPPSKGSPPAIGSAGVPQPEVKEAPALLGSMHLPKFMDPELVRIELVHADKAVSWRYPSASGDFAFYGLQPGSYALQFHLRGEPFPFYSSPEVLVPVGEFARPLVLQKVKAPNGLHRIQIEVRDPQGRRVAGVDYVPFSPASEDPYEVDWFSTDTGNLKLWASKEIVDVCVRSESHRPVILRGLSDGDQVRLLPLLRTTLRMDHSSFQVPKGCTLSASLTRIRSSNPILRDWIGFEDEDWVCIDDFNAKGEVVLNVALAGTYQLEWFLSVEGGLHLVPDTKPVTVTVAEDLETVQRVALPEHELRTLLGSLQEKSK